MIASQGQAGGSRLVLGDKSGAGKTLSNARASGQKGTGSVSGRARAPTTGGVPFAPSYRVRVEGGVPRDSGSALRAPTPVDSSSTGLRTSRVRAASVASCPPRKTESDEQYPPILAKPQNRDLGLLPDPPVRPQLCAVAFTWLTGYGCKGVCSSPPQRPQVRVTPGWLLKLASLRRGFAQHTVSPVFYYSFLRGCIFIRTFTATTACGNYNEFRSYETH